MSTLRKSMEEYLTMRRRLGFKLHEAGQRLEDFVCYMERRRASHISASLALTWAQKSPSVQPVIWAQRLGVVRGFARYLSAFDPHTEIPPAGLLPHRYHRRAPYLYTDEETEKILAAALALPPASGLRRWTYFTLIGLLSVTGLRPGEAVNLELEDVDLKECVLTVRGSKFGKSRWVPIHSSTRDALADYLRRREAMSCRAPGNPCVHHFARQASQWRHGFSYIYGAHTGNRSSRFVNKARSAPDRLSPFICGHDAGEIRPIG